MKNSLKQHKSSANLGFITRGLQVRIELKQATIFAPCTDDTALFEDTDWKYRSFMYIPDEFTDGVWSWKKGKQNEEKLEEGWNSMFRLGLEFVVSRLSSERPNH